MVNFAMKRYRFYLTLSVFVLISFLTIRLLKGGRWDGLHRIAVVINSTPMIIFSLEPTTKKAILITFPTNTLLEVPYGYGSYPASSVFRLGELDKKYGGGKLFSKSIENTFGIMVAGYFAAKNSPFLLSVPISSWQSLRQSYFSLSHAIFSFPKMVAIPRNTITNLSLIDMLRLWKAVRSIRSDRVLIVPLEETPALREEVEPDGTKIKVVDKDLLEAVIADNFQDQLIRSENISVEIVNASGRERIAAEFSWILTHMGANVILKSTAGENKDYSCLISFSKKNLARSHLVTRVEKFYQCKVSWQYEGSSQADIIIVLGREWSL